MKVFLSHDDSWASYRTQNVLKTIRNKKVLLRERKRHTARCVASARYAALSNGGGGGVPHPVMMGVVPHPVMVGGTPGSPPIQTWDGVPLQTCDGVPPHPDLEQGTPPPSKCELTNKLKTAPSLILRMRAVIKGSVHSPKFS